MYHDPNFDWIAHYKGVKTRINAKAESFAETKVPHKHLTSGRPLQRPRAVALVPAIRRNARILYKMPIGPVKPVRDILMVTTLGPKGNFRDIIEEVSMKYGVSVKEIIGPRRQKPLMKPRFEVCYRMKKECPHISFPQIGRLMGGRDHSSILSAVKRYEQMLASGEARL